MADDKIAYFPSPSLKPPSDNVVTMPQAMTIQPMQPTSFVFGGNGGANLFTIHPDGRITRGPAFTTEDEMSLRFWQTISEAFPRFLEATKR